MACRLEPCVGHKKNQKLDGVDISENRDIITCFALEKHPVKCSCENTCRNNQHLPFKVKLMRQLDIGLTSSVTSSGTVPSYTFSVLHREAFQPRHKQLIWCFAVNLIPVICVSFPIFPHGKKPP